jgi:hypothetical protein
MNATGGGISANVASRLITCPLVLLALGCHESKDVQADKCAYMAGADGMGQCLVARYGWDVVGAMIAAGKYRRFSDSLHNALEQARQPEPPGHYKLLDRQGENVFAFVDRTTARDTAQVRRYADVLCGNEARCVVRFWSDTGIRLFTLPLPPRVAAKEVAEYSRPPGRIRFISRP